MLGMIIGSVIGGYLPTLFGVSEFSFTSIITTGIGGIIGVVITYNLTKS